MVSDDASLIPPSAGVCLSRSQSGLSESLSNRHERPCRGQSDVGRTLHLVKGQGALGMPPRSGNQGRAGRENTIPDSPNYTSASTKQRIATSGWRRDAEPTEHRHVCTYYHHGTSLVYLVDGEAGAVESWRLVIGKLQNDT